VLPCQAVMTTRLPLRSRGCGSRAAEWHDNWQLAPAPGTKQLARSCQQQGPEMMWLHGIAVQLLGAGATCRVYVHAALPSWVAVL